MYNNVNRVLIGDGVNAGAITHVSGIKAGDLFFIRENGTIVTTNAAAALIPKFEKVTIAAGYADGKAILSSPIQGNTVSKYEGGNYVAPIEAVSVLGYNGTAGEGIQATEETEYRLRVLIKDKNRIQGQKQTFIDVNGVVAVGGDAETLAAEIAFKFAQKDYNTNFQEDLVTLERTSDGTRVAFAANASVIKGSDVVTITGHGVAAGTPVKFNGSAYVVAEVVDANTIKIDSPYIGATETILLAEASSGVYADAAEWGFTVTGLPQNSRISRSANEPLDEYEYVQFDATFVDVDEVSYSAPIAKTDAFGGVGYWKQVADIEEKAKGYLGDTDKRNFYAERIPSSVVVDGKYGTIVIEHAEINGGSFQDNQRHPLQTEMYIPIDSDQGTNGGDNFLHILNGYFSTKLEFEVIATLTE